LQTPKTTHWSKAPLAEDCCFAPFYAPAENLSR
jgi:hypothetical protein